MSKKVIFLGMGGTIAGTAASAADNVGYRAAQVKVEQLLQAIPTLQGALAGCEMESEQVAQVDSKDLDFSHWVALAQRAAHYLALPDVLGLVITHGTDTLEETSFFLSEVLPPSLLASKPVVLTCAMRPASSLSPDGPQNLLDAVAVVRTNGACGVVVVCAGAIHGGRDVQKVHTYRLDAFDSADAGPLGYVEEGVVRLVHGWPEADTARTSVSIEKLSQAAWPRVEIVMNYVGATGSTVRALCAAPPDHIAPVRGLVVAGTGNGTVHVDLEAALREAEAAGVRVVRSSRCARGRVVAATVPGSVYTFAHSNGLPPVKARIALVLELLA
jgi:L-asparaginase